MNEVRIATRRSRLAMEQASRVARLLNEADPTLQVRLVEITTTGDKDQLSAVTTLTEVGAFVRAVQRAVIEGRADIAVHSCKDLPVEGPAELVTFYPERASPWDVLCGADLESLPEGARVGTGSPRRASQLRRLRPDVRVEDIRGNVDTRLEKMRSGDFDAVVLAEAGLERLGLAAEVSHRFTLEEMVPAPGQAALAAEAVAGSDEAQLLASIETADVRSSVVAERELLGSTGAGCRSALGALGRITPEGLELTGFVDDQRGARFASATASSPSLAARKLKQELGL